MRSVVYIQALLHVSKQVYLSGIISLQPSEKTFTVSLDYTWSTKIQEGSYEEDDCVSIDRLLAL